MPHSNTQELDIEATKQLVADKINSGKKEFEGLSRRIFDTPETAYEEHSSANALQEFLTRAGFSIDVPWPRLPTAFVATAGSGSKVVSLCAEYDALPGLGYACGHHLIAGAAVAAGVGVAAQAEILDITVRILGTPAEEHGGGKIQLLEAGAFLNSDMVLMVHFVPEGVSCNPQENRSQAVARHRATFRGVSAHAAAAPHLAVNASDAVVLAQVGIGLLRQQIPDRQRVGLHTWEMGEVTNIIPDAGTVDFECRAQTLDEYLRLHERVAKCFQGAAIASGCELEMQQTEPLYEPLRQDPDLSVAWNSNMKNLGRNPDLPGKMAGGSTDMGNVSQRFPGLHPWLSIPGVTAPIHSRELAEATPPGLRDNARRRPGPGLDGHRRARLRPDHGSSWAPIGFLFAQQEHHPAKHTLLHLDRMPRSGSRSAFP